MLSSICGKINRGDSHMQINRLLEIVYILLNKKNVTARELSEHFEVSQRTIYRDIDALSEAGIPVYTNKGKGGGIRLLDNYVLNKSILSDEEQVDILSSLQGLNALNVPHIEPVLKKLAVVFDKNNSSWIDVDFSGWGTSDLEREKFSLLKEAILNSNQVTFDYFSSYGEKTERTIEPVKILFKGQGWYIYGFCRLKEDFRIFKITRIKNLKVLKENFKRDIPNDIGHSPEAYHHKMIRLILKIESCMAYRVYDEFDEDDIIRNTDGSFTIKADMPEGDWVYGCVLSYGQYAEVLEPKVVRENIKKKFEEAVKKYL